MTTPSPIPDEVLVRVCAASELIALRGAARKLMSAIASCGHGGHTSPGIGACQICVAVDALRALLPEEGK